MELPEGLFVRPVADADDLVAFNFPFQLEQKALPDGQSVEETEEGDLIIEGWAADFDGVDRQGENFIPGAFQAGIKSFLEGTASLNYHHKHDHVLGKVLSLEEKDTPERKGLWMRARVDRQPESSPLRYLYEQVKKGTLRGLSVGGFFKRVLTPKGYRIGDTDITEISITNVPVHARPAFGVVAGKALEALGPAEPPTNEIPDATLDALDAALANLSSAFEGKALPSGHDPAAAAHLSRIIEHVGRAREFATLLTEISEHDDIKALADRIETQGSAWDAEAHRLAAVVGPLPVPAGL